MMMGLMWLGCTPKPQPIDYGSDGCYFCKMTIVDPQHGAEAVTQKGKVFKFDAIECMLDFIVSDSYKKDEFAFLFVNDYLEPGKLLDAIHSTYLIHKSIKSPMGAYLSASSTRENVDKLNSDHKGDVYDWKAIVSKWEKRQESR